MGIRCYGHGVQVMPKTGEGGGGGGGVPEKNNMEKKGAGMGRKKLGGVRGGEPRG